MSMNVVTAAIAVMMMGMVAVGFFPLLSFTLARWTRWLFCGMIVMMFVAASRQAYWDLLQYASGDAWEHIRAALGGQKISTVFNIGVMVSCWLFLVARFLLIPEHERHKWRWWNAWLHPREKCLIFRRKR